MEEKSYDGRRCARQIQAMTQCMSPTVSVALADATALQNHQASLMMAGDVELRETATGTVSTKNTVTLI